MVHYMPWYASKPFSGNWGWHWTMDHFNPDNIGANGKQQIASHYQPLTDAYDFTSAEMVRNLTLNDGNEGISSFLEKRDPNWSND